MVEHVVQEEGWIAATPPPSEATRLRTLRDFGILDTDPTEEFDNITKLVSSQLDTAFALVSLVDKDRQWFKSACGIDAKETPREMAFCAHAIWAPEEPFVVFNALEDERFRNNPLVAGEPHIRFYAGIPLIAKNGQAIGTLCAIDTEPRNCLSEQQVELLQALAKMVMDELTLHAKNLELKRVIEYKSHFFSTMSHEIRTPLNGVLGMAQLLSHTELNDKQRHYADVISTSGNALLTIVNDILDLAKLEAGKLKICVDQYPVRALIDEVLGLYTPVAKEAGTKLSASYVANVPEFLFSDPGRLKQVLNNLVDNAIKFSQEGAVEIGVLTQDNWLRFEVRDTGIGIAEENLPHMFDRFVQEDLGSARRYEGTGLGLAIVKEIAELLHGEVGVSSIKGEGSTFWVQIPLTTDQFSATSLIGMPDSNESNATMRDAPTILVVEDNEVNRMVARELLEQANCSVIEAHGGQEGIELYQQKTPDLVLMDISMPGMDGKTAAKHIFETEQWQKHKTPVVALTAHVLPENQEEYKKAGMHGFLAKPLQLEKLQNILQEHVFAA